MALPQYGQATIQNRMMQPPNLYQQQPPQPPQPSQGTNQFSPPPDNNIQPPDFYHMGGGSPVDPRYAGQYNPNFSGPTFNPYAPPTPYGANKVSPTGQVQGIPPVGPGGGGPNGPYGGAVSAREASTGNNGSGSNGGQNAGGNKNGSNNGGNGDSNNGGGSNGGNNNGGGNGGQGNGQDNQSGDKGTFLQGFYNLGKDNNDQKAEAFLKSDPALQDTLAQLLGSRGDYTTQYQMQTGDIKDAWRQAHNYLTAERGSALQDTEGGLASSGMTRSSGALGELAGVRRDYGNQIEQARQTKTTGMTSAITERQNFMRQLELAKLQARSDALRRYAAEQMDVGGLL